MTDPPTGRSEARGAAEEEPIVALRSLLLSPEQRQLARLQRRLDDPELLSEDVSRVIAEAVALRAGRDDALGRALAPIMADAFQRMVDERPELVVEAVYPILGPAIRRAVRMALAGAIQSLNRALARSLSPRAIRWRIEAWRTGRPFAELVLLHTLVFRVEQVLLIHRETGVLLAHVVAPELEPGAAGADVVAGMITATSDFMEDAFSSDAGDGTSLLQVGERSVMVEGGPTAAIAAVVRGTPPEWLRTELAESLEELHLRFRDGLADFDGDTAPFAPAAPTLARCLEAEYR